MYPVRQVQVNRPAELRVLLRAEAITALLITLD